MNVPDIAPRESVNPVFGAQILTAALMGGVLIFAGVAFAIPPNPIPALQGMVAWVMAGFALLAALAALLLPQRLLPLQRYEGAEAAGHVAARWTGRVILFHAICEAAALGSLMAFIVDRQFISLLCAGALVALMLANFPTRTRWQHFLESATAFDHPAGT